MAKRGAGRAGSDDRALLALFRAIASRDDRDVARRLDESADLAVRPVHIGATRDYAKTYFLTAIHHYVYSGDTALHISAAAHQRQLAESLVTRGADVRARNRRGAEPLHYAADGGPAGDGWDASAQRDVIAYLIEAGADPDALDKSGVAPLHRAVRNRCSLAVSALIDHGADPLLRNKTGSTPLHLAVQNTGKSNSGSEAARDEQARIITLLLGHGASPTDADTNGKTVAAAATSDWIRDLLDTPTERPRDTETSTTSLTRERRHLTRHACRSALALVANRRHDVRWSPVEVQMTVDRLDPPGLLKIPEIANVSIATGTRIVNISGQTAVDAEGKVVGTTHLEQSRVALKNVKAALDAAGVTLADVAKFTTYIVDYSWDALEALMTAAKEVFGEPYPVTANTLVGVSALWLPDLLVEIEATAVA